MFLVVTPANAGKFSAAKLIIQCLEWLQQQSRRLSAFAGMTVLPGADCSEHRLTHA